MIRGIVLNLAEASIFWGIAFSVAPFFATKGFAAPLIERDGRYEFNWSTGKVRFYGVGRAHQDDGNYRNAEQSAWADGLTVAERQMPKVMADRLGPVARLNVEKLSKLAQSTISVSTTYFADQRVKVLLEAPIQKVTAQLVQSSAETLQAGSDHGPLVITLPKGSQPVAFVRVVDEHGRDMLTPSEIMTAVGAGAPLARWYRDEASSEVSATQEPVTLAAKMTHRGVIRVQSSEWKPVFARAIAHGRVSFVIQ
jgi:hypothetical protein